MNQEIAKIFKEIAIILEADNVPFKPQAYERAAEVIDSLGEDVKETYKRGGLKALEEIPGVGVSLAEKIEEYIKKGRIKYYDSLKKKMPVDIAGLKAVEGLGPKRIKELYQKLKIKNVKDLEKAIQTGKVGRLEHFGRRSEENLLRGLKFLKKETGRVILGYILPLAREIEETLKKAPGVKEVVVAGSIRRQQETIGDIDILAMAQDSKKVMEVFTHLPEVESIQSRGPTRSTVRLKVGLEADLRVVPEESFGAALQYFTGDKAHNIKMRERAMARGLKLNEYGLFRGSKRITGRSEEEIYRALGLDYIEPELRTDSGELEAAQKHRLPKLIPYGSLKGDLQTTTNWTDGATSIEEMAVAARKLGLEYIAITDHTRSLAMVHGLDEKRLAEQGKEIDRLNKKLQASSFKFQILKSAEVNINKDGSLDIADAALRKLDIVSVAVHSSFRMGKIEMTKRIIRALEHPLVNILFHPTGRLIQRREAYELDMEAIIKAAKKNNVALELDCFPDRMDLRDIHVRQAIAAGVKIVIDTDAHHPEHLKYLELGIGTARRGWATKDDVLNTLPADKLLAWFAKKR
ncbi:MAG: DNA polymerase/3'-5' exonuclease PolX [Patescibacteria group bacterium]